MALKIYQSSAGSGKTYTLVREYLRLILANPQFFRSTLAVTFTNDATGEMKERIIKALWQLSNGTNAQLLKDLNEAFGNRVDVSKQSAITLRYILHKYPDFSISTIDSFFLNITRALARELGLPGRYDVDMNRDSAIDYITNRLFISIGENKELTEWMEDFAYAQLDDEKGWNTKKELQKIAQELFKDSFRELHGDTKLSIDKKAIIEIRKQVIVFEKTMIDFGNKFFEIINSVGLNMSELSYGKTGFASVMKKFADGDFPKDYEFGSRFLNAIENENYFSKTAPAYVLNDESLKKDITNILAQTKKYFDDNLKEYLTSTSSLALIYRAGILNFLDEELVNYRHEKKLVLISDINKMLKGFITGDDTPFIYEKTGNTFKNFLMDEFQDTSFYQWQNFLPLLQNSLAEGNDVLTVGDVKQSIYRWRGGDIKLLLKNVDSDLGMFSEMKERITLANNFRSAQVVVDFNNALFSSVSNVLQTSSSAENILALAYAEENVKQEAARKKLNGYVQIELVNKENFDEELNYPSEAKEQRKVCLSKTFHIIKNQLEKKYSLGDMALLVRNNLEGNLLAEFLVLNGIKNINSRDSLLIQYAPQINFVVCLLRYISNPDDAVSKNQIAWFYSSQIKNSNTNFNEVRTSVEPVVAEFFAKRKYFLKLSLHETVSKLIAHFNLNKTPDAFIQRFEDLILEKTADEINDAQSFISWWDAEIEQRKISVQIPEGNNSISIRTIHRSKGLQFPIVIIPFTNWNLGNTGKAMLWVKPQAEPYSRLGTYPVTISSTLEKTIFREEYLIEEEEKNLEEINAMYVAFTRAEEKLFLLVEEKDKNDLKKAGDIIRYSLENTEELKSLFQQNEKNFYSGNDGNANIAVETKEPEPSHASSDTLTEYLISDALSTTGFKIKKYNTEDESEQIAFGITLHQLLSNFISENDKEKIIQSLSQLQLSETEIKSLSNEVEFVLQTLIKNNWTNEHYQIKTECDISNGSEILRPDRIMIKDKKAIVVDYKTGIPKEFHEEQIRNYKNVLTTMGYTEVETWLLYSLEKKLVKVN